MGVECDLKSHSTFQSGGIITCWNPQLGEKDTTSQLVSLFLTVWNKGMLFTEDLIDSSYIEQKPVFSQLVSLILAIYNKHWSAKSSQYIGGPLPPLPPQSD